MVVAVAVGADEAAELHAVDGVAAGLTGEVGDHVAALHLAVDEDVEAELLLAADPVLGGLALKLVELSAVDLALGELGAGLGEVVWLGVGAYGVGDKGSGWRSDLRLLRLSLLTYHMRTLLPSTFGSAGSAVLNPSGGPLHNTLDGYGLEAAGTLDHALQFLEGGLARKVLEAAGGVDINPVR